MKAMVCVIQTGIEAVDTRAKGANACPRRKLGSEYFVVGEIFEFR